MRKPWRGLALILGLSVSFPILARAELGWNLQQYTEVYGNGDRGLGQAREYGFQLGQSRLVVEFDSNDRSVAELFLLGTVRDQVPARVLADGEAVAKGRRVKEVGFKARDALTAEIREATVEGVVVRVDVRNSLVTRVAYCGKAPTCGFWDTLQNQCATTAPCDILDRALSVDSKLDEFQVKAQDALDQVH